MGPHSAYVLGLGPSSRASGVGALPLWAVTGLRAIGAVLLLASIGFAQWLEFRCLRLHSTWWIASTALAWLMALAVFPLVASPLWYEGQGMAEAVLVGVAAGAAMAMSVAMLTGVAAVRLVTPAPAAVSTRPEAVLRFFRHQDDGYGQEPLRRPVVLRKTRRPPLQGSGPNHATGRLRRRQEDPPRRGPRT
jgi:hypothetical protein